MSSYDKARSGLFRFGQIMTRSGQVSSCQRRDRSTSAKDRSSLVCSGQVQIRFRSGLVWSELGQVKSSQSQVRPPQVRSGKFRSVLC